MVEYKSMTEDDIRETATDYFAERKSKSSYQEHPTIVLIGGQPGAGKSAVADMVRAELVMQGGYIHIDADRMREHIDVGDSKPSSEQTQADAGRLVAVLRDQAIQGRRNIVEEGTFRNPDVMEKFVQNIQERGYNVELFAVAASREESLLGIYQRHELQYAKGTKNPRFVSEKYHDDAMQGFESTVAKIAAQLGRVRVANRSGELLYDSAIQTNKQSNPLEALATDRKLTDTKLAEVTKIWGTVESQAKQRDAPSGYLDSVSAHMQRLHDVQKERIHGHAMNQLDTNAATLARDTRYAQHTGGELAKAAYFRGVHEKASEFNEMAPDFAKYDATAGNRQTLREFPEVSDLEGRTMPKPQQANDGNSL
ncbi:toxin (plasmid) [Verminephrobacter aporrectodeae subsp. tuberculatae]|uniref:zeta toxin family protein n=1 Tax=Verminephrobacter aporrectodeae TaxID=1110389 RepID=UPI002238FF01|nr:zeta toxin family protein [Verminephrobacter aporrectodeae]MCW5223636.1 toxin [Verminephrobacter aporrectodeae subsp. tuberculatae]MCW5291470.1 toxin [Verminephrobacter aporrectodeae subsp. tuberculatae]